MNWPLRSPDLNPIQHVWDGLGRTIAQHNPPPRTLQDLKVALLEEWLCCHKYLLTLINSMRAHCEAYTVVTIHIRQTFFRDKCFMI